MPPRAVAVCSIVQAEMYAGARKSANPVRAQSEKAFPQIKELPARLHENGLKLVAIIGVRCGGWGAPDLKGALAIYADPTDLLAHLDQSLLKGQ